MVLVGENTEFDHVWEDFTNVFVVCQVSYLILLGDEEAYRDCNFSKVDLGRKSGSILFKVYGRTVIEFLEFVAFV